MNRFTDKVSKRIDRMSDEQLEQFIKDQGTSVLYRDIVLDSSTEGVLLTDRSGHVLYFNKILTVLTDCSGRKSHVGTFIKDPDVLAYIQKCLDGALGSKEMFYTRETQRDGELFIRVISSYQRESDLMIFRFMDYTFFNKFKQEFKKNESLASMTTMAAGVAHEIKNPLASISIYIQLLQRQLDKKGSITKEEAGPSINVISEEIERLNKIAVDFLFAVKPMSLHRTMADMNQVVIKTLSVCAPELEQSKIKLVQDLATTLPKLYMDTGLIQQSILNLVRNAMQAMDLTKKDNTITVQTYLDGDNVKVSVTDTGCGMSEETMSRIFEPYYTTKAQGTGLGLTTIFKIMKEHEGEVTVESHLGKGSVFTLTLPVPASERFRIGQ